MYPRDFYKAHTLGGEWGLKQCQCRVKAAAAAAAYVTVWLKKRKKKKEKEKKLWLKMDFTLPRTPRWTGASFRHNLRHVFHSSSSSSAAIQGRTRVTRSFARLKKRRVTDVCMHTWFIQSVIGALAVRDETVSSSRGFVYS